MRLLILTLCALTPLAAQTTLRNIPYATVPVTGGAQRTLFLDLYLPAPTATPAPCLVGIHGGGWRGGSRFPSPLSTLANQGFVVASIDYRLSGEAIWPAQIHDCKGAIRWLRANAATYGIDPDRIGAWGSSAGGHLVACLATMGDLGQVQVGSLNIDLEGTTGGNLNQPSRIQAGVDWFGPSDFLRMSAFPSSFDHDDAMSPESLLLGAAITADPERVQSANPAFWLSQDDATLQIRHGTRDTTVPYEQSEHFFRTARDGFGLPYDFRALLDAGHGGPAFSMAETLNFFQSQFQSTSLPRLALTASGALAEGSASTLTLTLSRTGSTATALRVPLTVASGPLQPGQDLQGLVEFLTLAPGQSSTSLTLTAIDDDLIEGQESLRLVIPARPDYTVDATQASVLLTLIDNDLSPNLPTVRLQAIDRDLAEPNLPGLVRLERTGSTQSDLFVRLSVSGTALADVDFSGFTPTIRIPAGATTTDLVLTPIDDAHFENTELWVVHLEASNTYTRAQPRSVSGRLRDDEALLSLPRLAITSTVNPITEGGPSGEWIITRSELSAQPLIVALSPSGQASAADGTPIPTTITIPANDTQVRLTYSATADAAPETDETLRLAIAPIALAGNPNPSGLSTFAAAQSLTISDTDRPAASLRLTSTPLRQLGEAAFTTQGPPNALTAIAVALAPGYLDLGALPLLLDPTTTFVLATDFADATGTFRLAFNLAATPALTGLDLYFQAAAFPGAAPPVFSAPLHRLLLAR